ncbi:MAG: hypothetical protein FWC80_07160 [Firmicutes bacterium]|nr:hypothetical protein [Bacillota bacterium]
MKSENLKLKNEEQTYIVDDDIKEEEVIVSQPKQAPLEKYAPKKKDKRRKKKKSKRNFWPIVVFVAAFVLMVAFSLGAELALSRPNLAIALVLIFVFLLISIVFDIIGVAVTKCDDAAFFAMASRRVRGAKKCLFLLRNADRVNSVCCDIIGEVLSILSGALSVVIVYFMLRSAEGFWEIMIPVLIAATIASLTAGGKAFTKTIAIRNAQKIVFAVGKIMSIFGKN